MLNNYIKENLDKNNVRNLNQLESVLREICQRIILIGLSQTTFFNYAAFYGGTCLRIFHSLNRWSEDLDFQVTSSEVASKINLDDYAVYCPWMTKSEPVGKTWSKEMTDAAVELFESEKGNREQRRKKREQRQKIK